MPDSQSSALLGQAQALLREGKTQEADDLLSQAQAEQAKEAGLKPEPPPPRERAEVLRAFMEELVLHLGNHPRLRALLAEYDAEKA